MRTFKNNKNSMMIKYDKRKTNDIQDMNGGTLFKIQWMKYFKFFIQNKKNERIVFCQ